MYDIRIDMRKQKETRLIFPETQGGWQKSVYNPVLGGQYGTCFDLCILFEDSIYKMWFSWRPHDSIAYSESTDKIHWSEPKIVLKPIPASKWEQRVNRPIVIQFQNQYHIWYTGQSQKKSWIGYATSQNGTDWIRQSNQPVLSPEYKWEKNAVMCPHVIWDKSIRKFRMWYSGGDQYEPNAIGYAISEDGVHWIKERYPIFTADKKSVWEQNRVAACQVIPWQGYYIMFYIGFSDIHHARIGIARSQDGIHDWERITFNPIISPTRNGWDHDACYKPFAIFEGNSWYLWYNGRNGPLEQIGLAEHSGSNIAPLMNLLE